MNVSMAIFANARALNLEHRIGSFEPGTEADFVVLDYNATPMMTYRMAQVRSLDERLFALMTLGGGPRRLISYSRRGAAPTRFRRLSGRSTLQA